MTDANAAAVRGDFRRSALPRSLFSGISPTLSARLALYGLIGAWLLFGLFGRDPWKPDEAYTFGVVNHIVQTGEWIAPQLAGEPFMEKPPLFFVTSAIFVQLAGSWLSPHDAARLATAFYVGLTLLFSGLAAGTLYGRPRALPCAIILIGCIGYLHPAHLLFTDHAMLAGIALALYGFANILERPGRGAVALGTGAGIAFMSKGLLGPGMLGLTALLLALLPAWRTRRYGAALLAAVLVFAPWALLWPWLLYRESPALFHDWLFVNNLGRFAGSVRIGPAKDHMMYLKILPWFALPALPLAAWHAWTAYKTGQRPWSRPEIQLPLMAACVMVGVLSAAGTARHVYALPILIPLALLGSARPAAFPQWLASSLRRLAVATGAILALSLWAGWLALLAGWPAGFVEYIAILAPGFVPRLEPGVTLLALGATAGWLWLLRSSRQSPDALPASWAASLTLSWVLTMTLWLTYLDFGNSYRTMIEEMKRSLPAQRTCMSNRRLGEPQRAMLQYFARIVTHREATAAGARCDLLLVQSRESPDDLAQDRQWTLLWIGRRPGDSGERFWLFQRRPNRRIATGPR
jgi:4-amino-4-deoxy-L-arabinose transferase-like glycosyltransferase